MNRRSLFRKLFGAVAATVAAPLIPTNSAPSGIIYAPYIPLVRKISPNMIASRLVGVQPMDGPTGQIFYLKTI